MQSKYNGYSFELNPQVTRTKVHFPNQFGIEMYGDLYLPENTGSQPLAAVAVSGPFGAVKEQASGLYASELASRGFAVLAFDPSLTGESEGGHMYYTTPDLSTEDFLAAVDFLSTQDFIDPDRIGVLGICGFGGFAINAAAADPRIKATAAMTMYDISRSHANGYFDAEDDPDQRYAKKEALSRQRTENFRNHTCVRDGGVVDPLPEDAPFYVKDYYDYYKTPRGYTERSLNSNQGWDTTKSLAFINAPILARSNEIRNAVLLVHGEKAHSCYFSRDAYANMLEGNPYTENKELLLIPDAVHTDLYDQKDVIPFDKLESFFRQYLNA